MTTIAIARLVGWDTSEVKRLMHSMPGTFVRDDGGWRLKPKGLKRRVPKRPAVICSLYTAPRQSGGPGGQVWVSGRGTLYHYDEDCELSNARRAEAYQEFGHNSELRLVTVKQAEAMGRRACPRC